MKQRIIICALATILVAATAGLPLAAQAGAMTEAPFDIRFSGVITAVPAAPGEPWQIGGQTVITNSGTRIVLTTGRAAVGMWAEVTARRQADDTLLALQITVVPPEVRLKGPVESKPEDNIGDWTIAGQTIRVTQETRISERGGPVDVGCWVEVNALEEEDGTLTALRIRGIEAQQAVEVFGAIQAFSETAWTLSTIPLAVNEQTHVVSEPQVGLLAHALAELQDDDTLLALALQVAWQEPGRPRQPVQFTGTVESLPSDGLNGNWVVSGRQVEVTPATIIIQVKGLAEVGAQVHVIGWALAERIVAMQITVLRSPSGSGRPFYLRGLIEGLPENGLFGTWVISGQQIEVTRQTRILGAQHIRLGAPAEVGGLQYQSGVRLAIWLRVREMGGPGPQPTHTPGPTSTPRPQPSHTPSPTHTPGRPGQTPNPSRTPSP